MAIPVAAALAIQILGPMIMSKLFGGKSKIEDITAKSALEKLMGQREMSTLDARFAGQGVPDLFSFGKGGRGNAAQVLGSIDRAGAGQRARAMERAGLSVPGVGAGIASESAARQTEAEGFAGQSQNIIALIDQLLKAKAASGGQQPFPGTTPGGLGTNLDGSTF